MVFENDGDDDEYEEIEEYLLVEFDAALDRQFLRNEDPLIITQLLDDPFMSVGPLSFSGKFERLTSNPVVFEMAPKQKTAPNEGAAAGGQSEKEVELVAVCSRKIDMKRVLIKPKPEMHVDEEGTEHHDSNGSTQVNGETTECEQMEGVIESNSTH